MNRLIKNEYFVPEEGKTLEDYLKEREKTPVHHLVRYRWAEDVLASLGVPGPVLDIACGAGYGSYRLAQRFPEVKVVGADYDADAITFARSKYAAPNLCFERVDVTRWEESLGEREFGCIISFDTIEHVEHREIMMQKVAEHLHPDGFLLLSTPVRSQNVLNPGWEHHKIEFARSALYDFLRRYFKEVSSADLGTLPCADVFERINRDETIYVVKMNPVFCQGPIRISFGH